MTQYRIKEHRSQAKLSQATLAERCGWEQARISHYETGRREPGLSDLQVIAAALGITVSDLLPQETTTGMDAALFIRDGDNVSYGPDTRGMVPLISWVSAGIWNEAEDHYQPGEGEQYLPCPASHGPHTYALRVTGDSMTAPYGRSYPDGIIIYVDPDQRGGVVSGERVIAKVNGDDKVTFKVFIDDGGKRYLKPLNPSHLVIKDQFRILGKVIGAYMEE